MSILYNIFYMLSKICLFLLTLSYVIHLQRKTPKIISLSILRFSFFSLLKNNYFVYANLNVGENRRQDRQRKETAPFSCLFKVENSCVKISKIHFLKR